MRRVLVRVTVRALEIFEYKYTYSCSSYRTRTRMRHFAGLLVIRSRVGPGSVTLSHVISSWKAHRWNQIESVEDRGPVT